jgi:tetratricopeptide (TPR) repeat protein
VSRSEQLDFFVSYTSPDRSWAEWIAWQLEAEGYITTIQAWDFRPGRNFVVAMQDAAVHAQRTVAVISPAFFASPYTSAEWAAAFVQDPDGRQGKFVPVRVRTCDPPGLHSAVVYIDLVGLDESAARSELLDGLRPGRRKPGGPPGFPGGVAAVVDETPDYPGDGPPIWSIPPASVSFEGRESALAGLEKRLAGRGRAAVTQAQAVYGLGGIGKTQLVARYADLHRDEYDIGWWIRAEQEATRVADLAALGQQLGLPEAAENDLPALAAATLGWLGRSSRWLLVIDNAAGLEAAAALMPNGTTGHMLITSQAHTDWGQIGAEPLALEVWEREESVEFLLNRTHKSEPDAANEIAELLGDLPLALAQAAAYTNKQGITLAGYRDRLLNDTLGVLAKGKPHDYKDTVTGTWTLAFEQIRENQAAARILSICAYLAPERIPRELLDRVVSGTGEGGKPGSTPGTADDAIEQLLGYSLLIPVADETLDMHRLVQQVIRDKQAQPEQEATIEAALQALADTVPDEPWEPTAWPAATRLLAHIIATTQCAQTQPHFGPQVAYLLDRASLYLQARGDLHQARDLARQGCDVLERLESQEAMLASLLGSLGTVLQLQGDLVAARRTQERALKIREAVYGPNHHEVAITLGNLGIVLRLQRDLVAAHSTLKRALKIEEAVYGPNHREVASALGNLGMVLRLQGDLVAARRTQERALKIQGAVYGANHHEIARTLGNLGIVLRLQGDLVAARRTQERALKIQEAVFGPNHHEVAITLSNLGIVLQAQGDHVAAHSVQERALEIKEAVYGPNHHEVAITLCNLGIVLQAQGDLVTARTAAARALSIFEQSLGPAHEHAVTASRLLASLTES